MAILAMLSQDEILRILNVQQIRKFTPFSLKSPRSVLKKIEETRRRGYAVSIQERSFYTGAVGAPVFFNEAVVGSLAIIGPLERLKTTGIERLGSSVKKIATELSSDLGHGGRVRKIKVAVR
jgi:DNA-binding IclR family transcriptional regulator